MRILGLAVIWCGIALLWHAAANLQHLASTACAAIVSGGVFAALRNWIGVALNRPTRPGVASRLKPYVPQVLAYLTIVLAVVTVGQLLILACGANWLRWWSAAAVTLGFMLVALFIDPSEYGLHAFYRERISRAYAGACNLAEGQLAGENRATEPRSRRRPADPDAPSRPLHLVCCAANDLSGDPVETLARGSRSAVLSKHGFCDRDALGANRRAAARVARLPRRRRRSTRTWASISMEVGPAVAFLMTALNLRLGLWLRHPAAAEASNRAGRACCSIARCSDCTSASGAVADGRRVPVADARRPPLGRRPLREPRAVRAGPAALPLHPALGLRRRPGGRVRRPRQRDCAASARTSASTSASTSTPLRPGPDGGRASTSRSGPSTTRPPTRGLSSTSKPTLTGDEPPDVLQYKTRNTVFPHESTGISSTTRRSGSRTGGSGLHTAEIVFVFVPPSGEPASGAGTISRRGRATTRPLTADWVFAENRACVGRHAGGARRSHSRDDPAVHRRRSGAAAARAAGHHGGGLPRSCPSCLRAPPRMSRGRRPATPTPKPSRSPTCPSSCAPRR